MITDLVICVIWQWKIVKKLSKFSPNIISLGTYSPNQPSMSMFIFAVQSSTMATFYLISTDLILTQILKTRPRKYPELSKQWIINKIISRSVCFSIILQIGLLDVKRTTLQTYHRFSCFLSGQFPWSRRDFKISSKHESY